MVSGLANTTHQTITTTDCTLDETWDFLGLCVRAVDCIIGMNRCWLLANKATRAWVLIVRWAVFCYGWGISKT